MKHVSRKAIVAGLVVGIAGLGVAVATAGTAKKSAGIQACGLMPDTKTSVRWEQFDKPYLEKAFKAAGVSARVVNAQGDPQKQKTQADQCIADGAKVLIIAPIDSGSAAAIEKAAAAKGVKSIDYDRQVEGGSAVLYASFNGHTVGVLQGKARTVYNANTVIRPGAIGTSGWQHEHTLMLSEAARADLVPELEIDEWDVKAGHAASAGPVDPLQLYFIMARGIPEIEARRLIVFGFLSSLLESIPLESVRERIAELFHEKVEV